MTRSNRPPANFVNRLEAAKSPVTVQRFVIAGGPGSGKTSLLMALAASGEICFPEVSRRLIREQRAAGGHWLPWEDLGGFALECARRMLEDIEASTPHARCFFDRGFPDLLGYLSHGGQAAPVDWRRASGVYARTLFFAPPWADIFVQDAERPQTFDEAREIGAHVRAAYVDCGFNIVDLVHGTVQDRVAQVLARIDAPRSLTGLASAL